MRVTRGVAKPRAGFKELINSRPPEEQKIDRGMTRKRRSGEISKSSSPALGSNTPMMIDASTQVPVLRRARTSYSEASPQTRCRRKKRVVQAIEDVGEDLDEILKFYLEKETSETSKILAPKCLAGALEAQLTDSQYESVRKTLCPELVSVSSLKKVRRERIDRVCRSFVVSVDSNKQLAYVDPVKLVTFVIKDYKDHNEIGSELFVKVVIDGTDASIQHHVWLVFQILDINAQAESIVWPLLVYEGKESTAAYIENGVGSFLKQLQSIKSVDDIAITFRFTPDLLSLWNLLNIQKFQCPYCESYGSYSEIGAPRTDFTGALFKVSDPLADIVPCLLHARLRVADHRLRALQARGSRKARERGHTQADALRLLESLGCKAWDTKGGGIRCWLTAKDAKQLEVQEDALAEWEFGKGEQSPWKLLYELMKRLEEGFDVKQDQAFQRDAQSMVTAMKERYGVQGLQIYEHIVAFHGVEIAKRQTVSGVRISFKHFENQRTEAEHHANKVAMNTHTFKNGTRGNCEKVPAVKELLLRSLLMKTIKSL